MFHISNGCYFIEWQTEFKIDNSCEKSKKKIAYFVLLNEKNIIIF